MNEQKERTDNDVKQTDNLYSLKTKRQTDRPTSEVQDAFSQSGIFFFYNLLGFFHFYKL